MNVITVSREYGAGGAETAKLLAEALGWELLDRELLHRAAALEQIPDAELERLDETAGGLFDRFRLNPPHQRYIHGLQEAVRQATARGNVVLVGRGARQLVGDAPNVFHLRLEAPRQWRVQRMARLEHWGPEEALVRVMNMDQVRERFLRYFFGAAVNTLDSFHLVVNTGRVPLADAAGLTAATVRRAWPALAPAAGGRRVLTLTRQMAATEADFVPALAERLGLRVWDRSLLEQEAVRLGVDPAALEKVDEQPAGILQRYRPGNLHQRYFEVLRQLMGELASRGDVLLVGRGGSRFLRDRPEAFHVRALAPLQARVQRVMQQRWLGEAPARQLIAQNDGQRQLYYQDFFEADWNDPLEYHVTVNIDRLSGAALDAIASAAQRHWARPGAEPSGSK